MRRLVDDVDAALNTFDEGFASALDQSLALQGKNSAVVVGVDSDFGDKRVLSVNFESVLGDTFEMQITFVGQEVKRRVIKCLMDGGWARENFSLVLDESVLTAHTKNVDSGVVRTIEPSVATVQSIFQSVQRKLRRGPDEAERKRYFDWMKKFIDTLGVDEAEYNQLVSMAKGLLSRLLNGSTVGVISNYLVFDTNSNAYKVAEKIVHVCIDRFNNQSLLSLSRRSHVGTPFIRKVAKDELRARGIEIEEDLAA
ncbi:hypothetical protein COU74_02865 [Candidatus Peregrinibacteria bacterium CG10_big_fil_rev_8_21_14_0_10_36_19]|nr:MAG: hypothetical protein COU74_02865 [Candidatus Peregrinibacteria bacterium CG10_big_fil_rev_8_21_14_0_10_36_19]